MVSEGPTVCCWVFFFWGGDATDFVFFRFGIEGLGSLLYSLGDKGHLSDVCEGPTGFLGILWISSKEIKSG